MEHEMIIMLKIFGVALIGLWIVIYIRGTDE